MFQSSWFCWIFCLISSHFSYLLPQEIQKFQHWPHKKLLIPLAHPIKTSPSISSLENLAFANDKPFEDIFQHQSLTCWNRSNHIFPAAFPRTWSGSTSNPQLSASLSNLSDPKDIAFELHAQNLSAQLVIDPLNAKQPQLFISVARYYRKPQFITPLHHPLTLLLTHANGLHKETWEPTLAHLLSSSAGQNILEVWSFDVVNHGQSATINRSHLGTVFDWSDNARDILHFILSYLPHHQSAQSVLPKVLPRLNQFNPSFLLLDNCPPSVILPHKFRNRRLGLVGHSLGGCTAALAATSLPELFSIVILVDPVIGPKHHDFTNNAQKLASSAVIRRDQWKNSSDALNRMKAKLDFFGRWNPMVLERY
ncbi:hypothetical protein O181_072765, partial [Austropuccinia psidii MF-1]|nr:hypothetical protein [Austropuccinia psidii MF-1]